MFTAPHHRSVAVGGGYPGGWIGIKPLAPTINWSNQYMARCVGKESRTAIVFNDDNRPPHELVRDQSDLHSSGKPVPMIFDGEPCSRYNNRHQQPDERSAFPGLGEHPAGEPLTIIIMAAPILFWRDGTDGWAHLETDSSVSNSASAYNVVRRIGGNQYQNVSASFQQNTGSRKVIAEIALGTGESLLWPLNTWAILGFGISASGASISRLRRPSGPVLNIVGTHQNNAVFGLGDIGLHRSGSANPFAPNSTNAVDYIGFQYHLPCEVTDPELIDLMDNPYQIFNW